MLIGPLATILSSPTPRAIGSIDVDEYPDVAKQYVFEGIPMITVLRPDGSPERVYDGPILADALIHWLHRP